MDLPYPDQRQEFVFVEHARQQTPQRGIIPDRRAQAALWAPALAYYSHSQRTYIGFRTTVPEGAVIPTEMIGHPFYPGAIFTRVLTHHPGIALGDRIQVQWTALDGSATFQSALVEVTSTTASLWVNVPDREVARFTGKAIEVVYIHHPLSGGASPSLSAFATVAPALKGMRAARVEGVENGVLDTTAHPNGIRVEVFPIGNLRNYNALEIRWTQDNGAFRDYQRRMTVRPDGVIEYRIDPAVYQGQAGRRVRLNYNVFLGAGMDPNLLWSTGPLDQEFLLK